MKLASQGMERIAEGIRLHGYLGRRNRGISDKWLMVVLGEAGTLMIGAEIDLGETQVAREGECHQQDQRVVHIVVRPSPRLLDAEGRHALCSRRMIMQTSSSLEWVPYLRAAYQPLLALFEQVSAEVAREGMEAQYWPRQQLVMNLWV